MAFSFPLSVAAFADKLRVASMAPWRIVDFVETSGTARGEAIVSHVAWPRWRTEITLVPAPLGVAVGLQALFEAIGPSGTFYLYDHALPGPQADLDGAILGAATPTLHTIGGDNRSVRITGLPAGYVLTAGDKIAVSYGSSPVRRLLVRVCEDATANGSGLTPSFEVRPALRPGITTGIGAGLIKPAARMMIEPGSLGPGGWAPLIAEGASFAAIEAY